MTDEPYQSEKIPDHWASSKKRAVLGKMVAVSGLRLLKRGTNLMFPRSRSFPRYTVVEITATDQDGVSPGDVVESVLYLGFFEVTSGGIIVVGEDVHISDMRIGRVVGFSDIHEPNHLNILVYAESENLKRIMKTTLDRTTATLEIGLDDEITFGHNASDQTSRTHGQ